MSYHCYYHSAINIDCILMLIYAYFFVNSLGLQYRFDIIHDDGDGELEIGEHFLKRMRNWKITRGLFLFKYRISKCL